MSIETGATGRLMAGPPAGEGCAHGWIQDIAGGVGDTVFDVVEKHLRDIEFC